MDPAEYDDDAYRAQLLHHRKQSEVVVFHAAFVPAAVSAGPILVAATSSGMIHVFELAKVLQPEYWELVDQHAAPSTPAPSLSFQAHPSQIYSLAFTDDARDPLLVSGGDHDFRLWRWADIAAALRNPSRELNPVHVAHLERKTMGYRGALLPFSEINAIAVAASSSTSAGRVFLAGGDAVAHEFDLTTHRCVRRYEGHKDYLHSLRYVAHSQELVTGSEDGTVALWDARSSHRLDLLTPQPMGAATQSPSASNSSRWVGSVTTDASETWLACGGGSGALGERGFLGMWHLPSRVPVHYTETPASDVYDLAFHHTDLLTVGSDAYLRKWNRSSGALLSAARSTVPSAQFCVVDAASDLIVLGGYSPTIDVCMMPGVVSFSLLAQAPKPMAMSR